ncbi:MAG: hypothetical protein IJX83_11595 [Lachnospiraceae bacterium]|nr:hypothetical protein [Lachnospiraceae bacterium]
MYDGYKELAAAVIKQAVRDYEKVYKHLLRHPDSKSAKAAVAKEKKFFYGQWFEMLADHMDGPRLVRMVEEKVRREVMPK